MGYRTRLNQLRREKSAKEEREITYQEIAAEAGIAYSTIQRYAHGVVARPDYTVLASLASYFGVPVEKLVIAVEDDVNPGQRVAVAAG